MEKQTIYFTVDSGQGLTRKSELKSFAIGTINYIHAHFDLPGAWGDFEKVEAVWFNDEAAAVSDVNKNGSTVVPQEVLNNPGLLKVDLVGTNYKRGKLWQRWTTYPVDALELQHTNV